MARRVSEEEGLLIGGSCGTAVKAALDVAADCASDDLVVVLLPDSGRLYLSTLFNDDWMAGYGFTRLSGPVVADVVDSRRSSVPNLVYVQPHDQARDAVRLMREHGVSQLPVATGEMPLAAAEVMGSVSELRLMDLAFDAESILDKTVEDVMSTALPTIGSGQPVAMAVEMLDTVSALLVLDGGRPSAVISSTDVLSFLSRHSDRLPTDG
jgi:cystathionine beta-synthase